MTVNTWPDGDGEPDVTPFAGHQVRYEYDAAGRLTNRWHYGKLSEGVTDDAQRPFIEKRVFVWEGGSLAAEAAYGNAEETIFRWRKTHVPGPSGLDDAVQESQLTCSSQRRGWSDVVVHYAEDVYWE